MVAKNKGTDQPSVAQLICCFVFTLQKADFLKTCPKSELNFLVTSNCHTLDLLLLGLQICTVKFLNFRILEDFAVIYLKFKQRDQIIGYFIKKDPYGIADSEDPDQTAPRLLLKRSSLIWVCTVCPDLSVCKLRIITVIMWFLFRDVPLPLGALFYCGTPLAFHIIIM